MRDHRCRPIGVANRKGPRGRAVGGADRVNGRAQQKIGVAVVQRQAVPRQPPNLACHRLDQGIGRDDLAVVVEDEGRQTERLQNLGGRARSFELQAGGQSRRARNMRTDVIQLVDCTPLDGSAHEFALEHDGETVARRQRHRGRRRMSQPARI